MRKPIVIVPMGDPAGVGPEILVKAFADEAVRKAAVCIAAGSREVLENALKITGVNLALRVIKSCAAPSCEKNSFSLDMLEASIIKLSDFRFGEVSAAAGKAAFDSIEASVAAALRGEADAVATTPINKEALRAAQVPFIGHTEIFASLTGTKDPLTMFETRGLRVFFLSRHVSLKAACDLVKKERIIDYVERIAASLKQFGISSGTIAIAGLNPHSGEHGLFGDEEEREVRPAVEELKARGYDVEGPIGADSVFHLALHGRYNSVLSLYHDQGHIATKTLDFERTISVTAGMPILRTSVDHGTAFDIAGKNTASAVSMKEAIILAAKYAPAFMR